MRWQHAVVHQQHVGGAGECQHIDPGGVENRRQQRLPAAYQAQREWPQNFVAPPRLGLPACALLST